MFGQNSIVGKKFFADAPPDSLLVTSMFYTIQGEGPYRGMPAFFIRLAKCNLACSFCDTYFDSGTWLTFDEILAQIKAKMLKDRAFNGLPMEYVENFMRKKVVLVVTGGEPTLQSALKDFLLMMMGTFKHRQIESNGTMATDFDSGVTYVISPKCMEQNGEAIRYLTPRADEVKKASCLKFVMEAYQLNNVTSPYCSVPDWALALANEQNMPVFVSPMNRYNREPQRAKALRAGEDTTIEQRSSVDEVISFWEPGLLDMEANRRNHEYAARYCMETGCIFQVQIHLLASLA